MQTSFALLALENNSISKLPKYLTHYSLDKAEDVLAQLIKEMSSLELINLIRRW